MSKRIVTLGGGTGNFVVLSGLRPYDLNLKAVVAMSDSGGSSGVLRDEYGVLPPGDIRQCLVALSDSSDVLRKLFLYRFEGGPFDGHNFGNIFLSALEKISGDMDEAVYQAAKVLNVHGQVIPVTKEPTDLCVELENGEQIIGESLIDEPEHDGELKIIKAYLTPTTIAPNPYALEAISKADTIVIGPGDLFTSIIPVLLVPGIAKALQESPAKKVYIANLMTKYGQTNNMTASQLVDTLEDYLGKNVLSHILLNNTSIGEDITALYASCNEYPIVDDFNGDPRIIRGDIISDEAHQKGSSDQLKRSILRHSPKKLGELIHHIAHHD